MAHDETTADLLLTSFLDRSDRPLVFVDCVRASPWAAPARRGSRVQPVALSDADVPGRSTSLTTRHSCLAASWDLSSGSRPAPAGSRRQPGLPAFSHELIVVQVRIRAIHAIDLGHLSDAQRLIGVEAPGPFEQPLAPQYFVEAWDASGEPVRGVEKRRIRVGDVDAAFDQMLRDRRCIRRDAPTFLPQLDRSASPDSPVAEEPADNADCRPRRDRRRVGRA